MKHLVSILTIVVFGGIGCQHPSEVTLTNPVDSTGQIEITPERSDSSHVTGVFDPTSVTNVFPDDEKNFGATLTAQRTVQDYLDLKGVRQIETIDVSRVLFDDRSLPEPDSESKHGFFGQVLASVRINTVPMDTIPHRVYIPLLGYRQFGVEYVKSLIGIYQPGAKLTWTVSVKGSVLDTFSVKAPDDLVIQNPVGGTKIDRTQSLELRWSGRGSMVILISAYYPLLKVVAPLLHIRPAVNTGRLVLEPRILGMLPKERRYFVFTFVLNNRKEFGPVAVYPARILCQASCAYNSFVELF